MNIDILIDYIKSGANVDVNLLRKCALGAGFFFFFPMYLIEKEREILFGISLIMQILSIIFIFTVFVLTFGNYTIKKRLWINLLFPFYLVSNSLFFATLLFIIQYQLSIMMIFLYVPPILSIFLTLIRTRYMLKKDTGTVIKSVVYNFSQATIITGGIGCLSGFLGMRFGESLFQNASQTTIINFLLISFVFLSCLFSIGINNVIKLYYMHMIEKKGIRVNDEILSGTVYLSKKDRK